MSKFELIIWILCKFKEEHSLYKLYCQFPSLYYLYIYILLVTYASH